MSYPHGRSGYTQSINSVGVDPLTGLAVPAARSTKHVPEKSQPEWSTTGQNSFADPTAAGNALGMSHTQPAAAAPWFAQQPGYVTGVDAHKISTARAIDASQEGLLAAPTAALTVANAHAHAHANSLQVRHRQTLHSICPVPAPRSMLISACLNSMHSTTRKSRWWRSRRQLA